jgi:hypothetical protein
MNDHKKIKGIALYRSCIIFLLLIIALIPPTIATDTVFQGNPDLTVTLYEATLYDNGTLTEHYTYDVKTSGKYHMLYRSWEEPLLFTKPTQPSVMIVSVSSLSGAIAYAKDDFGNVAVYGDSSSTSYKSTIGQSAQNNEAGIYSTSSFPAGQYTVAYTYVIYPRIEYDGSTTYLNLKFAGQSHLPYNNIKITIRADGIQQVFASPPTLNLVLSGNTYTFSGSAAADENITIKMLGSSTAFSQIPGFRTQVTGLAGQTVTGSSVGGATSSPVTTLNTIPTHTTVSSQPVATNRPANPNDFFTALWDRNNLIYVILLVFVLIFGALVYDTYYKKKK